jgi:hypothetical protein
MIYVSKHIGLLTPIIHTILQLIKPFVWFSTFVPLLPQNQIDYIEAPHPFIMGFHSDDLPDLEVNVYHFFV